MMPLSAVGHGEDADLTEGLRTPPRWGKDQHLQDSAASSYAPPVVMTHMLDATLPTELLANPTFDYGALTIGVTKPAQDQRVLHKKPNLPTHACDVFLSNPIFEDLSAPTTDAYDFHADAQTTRKLAAFDRAYSNALSDSCDVSETTVELPEQPQVNALGGRLHENDSAVTSPANPRERELPKDDESAPQSLEIFSANSSGLENVGSDCDMKIHAYDDAGVNKTLSEFLATKPNPARAAKAWHGAPAPEPCEHAESPEAAEVQRSLRPIRTGRFEALSADSPLYSVPHTHRPQECWSRSGRSLPNSQESLDKGVSYTYQRGGRGVDGEGELDAAGGAHKTLRAYQVASESFHAQRLTLAQVFAQSMHELATKSQGEGAIDEEQPQGGGQTKAATKRQKKTALARMHDFVSGKALRKAERV